MKSRVTRSFELLKASGQTGLIPFIIPGISRANNPLSPIDHSSVFEPDNTVELILGLEAAGSDIIEIGIPFSDPVADGPVIQQAAHLALQQGINTDRVFELVEKVRQKSSIPLVLLVYYNCVYRYGRESFIRQCRQRGVDGLIIPDLPLEERGEISALLKGLPLDLITLVSPTSGQRLKRILNIAPGFVYCISRTGVTGERPELSDQLTKLLADIKGLSNTPRAVGFGISNQQQVRELRNHCEGVIVGSALVRRLLGNGLSAGLTFIRELRIALDQK